MLCFDPLTDTMPGPAIRAWHLAEQLARTSQVVLAGTAGATRTSPAMEVRAVSGPDLDTLLGDVDAVFAPTSVVRRHPAVVESGLPLCIDMYIPTHLENLEALGQAGGEEHVAAVEHQVSVINDDLRSGDFFLCASERQRDFWLGSLASLGRLNPATYADDPTLRRLIDVVPFGLDPAPPGGERGMLRRAFPGIGERDPVVIWGGGVYNWFDPLSLLVAVDELRVSRPDIRLVLLGMRNPNPDIPEMRVASQLRAESDRRGLTGTHVFFNEGWVPYDQRAAYLADADVAASTHLAHVETHFSFRTRVLDYLWAGLPMVLTGGDTLSDGIQEAGLGITVGPADPAAIAAAIDRLLADPPDRRAVREYGARFSWDRVAAPLLSFAAAPRVAADRDRTGGPAARPGPDALPAPAPVGEPAPAEDALEAGLVRLARGSARRLSPRLRRLPQPVRRWGSRMLRR